MGFIFEVDGIALGLAMFYVSLGVLAHVLESISDWTTIKDKNVQYQIIKEFALALLVGLFTFDIGILGVNPATIGFAVAYGALGYSGKGMAWLFDQAKSQVSTATT